MEHPAEFSSWSQATNPFCVSTLIYYLSGHFYNRHHVRDEIFLPRSSPSDWWTWCLIAMEVKIKIFAWMQIRITMFYESWISSKNRVCVCLFVRSSQSPQLSRRDAWKNEGRILLTFFHFKCLKKARHEFFQAHNTQVLLWIIHTFTMQLRSPRKAELYFRQWKNIFWEGG